MKLIRFWNLYFGLEFIKLFWYIIYTETNRIDCIQKYDMYPCVALTYIFKWTREIFFLFVSPNHGLEKQFKMKHVLLDCIFNPEKMMKKVISCCDILQNWEWNCIIRRLYIHYRQKGYNATSPRNICFCLWFITSPT